MSCVPLSSYEDQGLVLEHGRGDARELAVSVADGFVAKMDSEAEVVGATNGTLDSRGLYIVEDLAGTESLTFKHAASGQELVIPIWPFD